MRRVPAVLSCLVAALAAAPPALAEVRSGSATDPAGDAQPGRDLVGTEVSFDTGTGALAALVRLAGPIDADENLNVTASLASAGAGGGCGTGTARAGLSSYVGSDPTVFVSGNPALTGNPLTDFTTELRRTDGVRTIAPDRTSVRLTGVLPGLAGANLTCVADVQLFVRGAALVPDRIASPFALAAARVTPPAPPAATPVTPQAGAPAPAPAAPAPVAPAAVQDATGPAFLLSTGGGRLVATRSGVVRLQVGGISEAASGRVTLRTDGRVRRTRRSPARVLTLGTGAFDATAGATASAAVRLSPVARRLLRARGHLRVRAAVTLTDAAGNAVTRRATYTLAARR